MSLLIRNSYLNVLSPDISFATYVRLFKIQCPVFGAMKLAESNGNRREMTFDPRDFLSVSLSLSYHNRWRNFFHLTPLEATIYKVWQFSAVAHRVNPPHAFLPFSPYPIHKTRDIEKAGKNNFSLLSAREKKRKKEKKILLSRPAFTC